MLRKLEPLRNKTCLMGSTRSNTKRAVQPKKMASGLKFHIKEEEQLYYLCSEKSADQLHVNCPADLCLCFHIRKKQISHDKFQCSY